MNRKLDGPQRRSGGFGKETNPLTLWGVDWSRALWNETLL